MDSEVRHRRTPARVLLVVEQPLLAEVIRSALARSPYTIRVAPAEDAAFMVRAWRPHLAVVDADLADDALPGVADAAPPGAASAGVIALTRRSDLRTTLAAFARGADDVLVLPFVPQEFAARVRAVVRRTHRVVPSFAPVLQVDELEIDILNRSVRVGGRALHLTALDQSLLYLLAVNAGRVVSRDEILDLLWGADFAAESNVVDRHVRNLRAKLDDDWQRPRYIATVPGRGYRFLSTSTEPALATLSSGRMTW